MGIEFLNFELAIYDKNDNSWLFKFDNTIIFGCKGPNTLMTNQMKVIYKFILIKIS